MYKLTSMSTRMNSEDFVDVSLGNAFTGDTGTARYPLR